MDKKPFLTRTMRDEKARDALIKWHEAIQENNGARARLRHCREPGQVVLQSAYHHLKASLPHWPPSQTMALAAIAGLIANVENHNSSMSFAQKLGSPKTEGGSATMSETRLRQLIKSRDWSEFYRRMRRAIRMLKSSTNIWSIADYTLQFGFDLGGKYRSPNKRFQFRFADDYFEPILNREKKKKKKEAP